MAVASTDADNAGEFLMRQDCETTVGRDPLAIGAANPVEDCAGRPLVPDDGIEMQ